MSETPVLLIFEKNWADEFDYAAMRLYTQEKWDLYLDSLDELDEEGWFPWEWYFGTNEWMEFRSKEEYLSCIDVVELTMEEHDKLREVLGTFGKGNFPFLEY